jgi:rubredoxin
MTETNADLRGQIREQLGFAGIGEQIQWLDERVAAYEQPQATLTDGGTSSGRICRRCGVSPRDWEDLTDGLCPECSFDEVLYERY